MKAKTIANDLNELGIRLYWRLTDAAVEAAPDAPGIFVFFDERGKLLLMGSAVKSLRDHLRSHWKGYEGKRTCGAAFVGIEKCHCPLEREAELAEIYTLRYGRAPRREAV